MIGHEMLLLVPQEPKRLEYFQMRPSWCEKPIREDGIRQISDVQQLAIEYRQVNDLDPNAPVPLEAVTRTGFRGSRAITLVDALIQAPRIAHLREVPTDEVRAITLACARRRRFAFLSEPRVNILELNRELDRKYPKK